MIMNKNNRQTLPMVLLYKLWQSWLCLLWLPPFWEQPTTSPIWHGSVFLVPRQWQVWEWGHVCMAFPGALLSGPHGRSGQCGPKLRTGDTKAARDYASAALQLTCIFAFLFSAVCLIFTGPLLDFFHLGDPQTYAHAEIYMKITCGLVIFSYLNYTLPEFIQLREIQKHRLSPI